jgi:hypothetical protein
MTNRNKNELQTSQDFEITVAQILRGVFDGSIHQSEVKLELTSANDSNAFLLSFRPVRCGDLLAGELDKSHLSTIGR